ncbi:MAG: hypothetical protein HPY64_04755 [Anaerolineae bacterium]|nr:hypothetical protein [Anaerolineae bacterium]
MFSRILFVDSEAAALARITRAIERTGLYEADAFVTGQAALEHAALHPPDLAVIALNLGDMPPVALAMRLREIRPGLPIVLRAATEPDTETMRLLSPQGVVRGNYAAREVLPLLEYALTEGQSLATRVDSLRTPGEKPSLLKRSESLAGPPGGQPVTPVEEPPLADDSFLRLAAEEPPLPGLEDSGTISDLIAVASAATPQDHAGVIDIPEEMIEETPSTALADTAELVASTASPDRAGPAPLPHLPAARTRPVRPGAEPTSADIRAAALALELTQHTLESAAQASVLIQQGQVIAVAGQLPPEEVRRLVEVIDWQTVLAEGTTKIKFATLPESRANYMVVAAPTVEDMVLMTVYPENMHLRTIRQQTRAIVEALSRTAHIPPEEQTPSASGAAEPEIAAPMPEAPPAQSPAPVPPSAAPESPPAPGENAPRPARTVADARRPAETSKQETYACAWILRDPAGELDPDTIRALATTLNGVLAGRSWTSEQVEVQPDYVSIVLSIPAEEALSRVIQTLMGETARCVAALRPELGSAADIWADAYYMVTPGRPLTAQEVTQFISYQRQT